MSLMSKLSAIALLSSSLLATTEAEVVKFLENSIGKNPNVKELNIKIVEKKKLDKPKGWDAFIVNLEGKVKQGNGERPISQRMIYFANDGIITTELIDMKTGDRLNSKMGPKFSSEYYSKANLIYGNEDAKHKVAIFSDPLCPFCRRFVPEAINYMKQYPETFAVYYYHLPLVSLHPAAVALTKAAIAAELKGHKNVTLDMYKVEVGGKEPDQKKIVDEFNKVLGTKLTVADIHTPAVEKHAKHDMDIAKKMMVNGTPTVFFDGEKDGSKRRYKEVKVK